MAAAGTPMSSAKFAVLGGGISGLAAAHRLMNRVADPSCVSVFEASSRLGGWVNSVVTEEGAVFESGPRSLRPVGEQGKEALKLVRGAILISLHHHFLNSKTEPESSLLTS